MHKQNVYQLVVRSNGEEYEVSVEDSGDQLKWEFDPEFKKEFFNEESLFGIAQDLRMEIELIKSCDKESARLDAEADKLLVDLPWD